jgi:xanthine dehydrogenase iron-sulfur cluster and FAD-binding subunit A
MLSVYLAMLAAGQDPAADAHAKRRALAEHLGRCVGYTSIMLTKNGADMLKLSEEMTLYWQLAERADPAIDIKTVSDRTKTAEEAASGHDGLKTIEGAATKLAGCRDFVSRNMAKAREKRQQAQPK